MNELSEGKVNFSKVDVGQRSHEISRLCEIDSKFGSRMRSTILQLTKDLKKSEVRVNSDLLAIFINKKSRVCCLRQIAMTTAGTCMLK